MSAWLGVVAALVVACGGDPAPAEDDTVEVPPADTVDAAIVDTSPDTEAPADTNLCAPDSLFCVSVREAAVCNATGDAAASVTPCNGATACEPATGLCRPTICAPDKQLCLNLQDYQVCKPDGSGWSDTRQCAGDRFCADGACRACQANRVECLSETSYRECPEDSSGWSEETDCEEGERCIAGGCVPCDLQTECPATNKLHRWCANPAVDFDETVTCQPGRTCMAGGCFACVPDTVECQDELTYRVCQPNGLAWVADQPCDEEEVCFEGACLYYGCVPRVLFLVDRSGSMGTNWDEVRSTVSTIVQANPTVRFGLKSFPSGGSTCGVDGVLDVGFGQNQAHTLDVWFEGHSPDGATPIVAGLEAIEGVAESVFGNFGGTLIVLSDGDDTCYAGDETIKVATATVVAKLCLEHYVKTYVIGYNFSGDTEMLDNMANNGCTGLSEYIAADDEEDLYDAFQFVIDDIKVCEEGDIP